MRATHFLNLSLVVIFVLCALLSFAVNGFVWIGHKYSFKSQVRNAFEKPGAEKRLIELFKLVESRSIDSELEMKDAKWSEDYYKHPKVRRLPYARIKAALQNGDTPTFLEEGIAFYDAEDRFLALQLGCTRMGFFISRCPTLIPANFENMFRFPSEDVYIMGVTTTRD